MSARHSPACAVLEKNTLAVFGGLNAADKPVGTEACLTFDIAQCKLNESMRRFSPPESALCSFLLALVRK